DHRLAVLHRRLGPVRPLVDRDDGRYGQSVGRQNADPKTMLLIGRITMIIGSLSSTADSDLSALSSIVMTDATASRSAAR
ncbi:hypothetical protein ACNQUF_12705, partial [Corynebacterium diphtheriae]